MDWKPTGGLPAIKNKGDFMKSRDLADKVAEILSKKKAEDIMIIDIAQKSSMADYMILASGANERQIGALKEELMDEFAKQGFEIKSVEGKKESGWILVDGGDLIISLLTEEQRKNYNIEKVWADCESIVWED